MNSGTQQASGCLLVALSHPDDEVGCAGTIAAHRALGTRVVLLFLTRGEATESLGPQSQRKVAIARMRHAQEVSSLLDCELQFLDFPDTRVEVSASAIHRVARVIATIKPDAVLTWGDAWVRGPRHPDHQATGQIVVGAVTVARIKRRVAPTAPHRATAPVFTLRDRHSQLPCAAIDVSAQLDRVLAVGKFYQERVGWPEVGWLQNRLQEAGGRWGVSAAEEFDAWESQPGLRTTLLGDYLPL